LIREIFVDNNIITINVFIKIDYLIIFIYLKKCYNSIMGIGDWGLGIGIGDWGLGPIPNPQSPIPNPQIIE